MRTISTSPLTEYPYLTFNRFSSEAFAFEKYVDLRDSESEDAVLYAVREELDMTEAGDFELF